MKSAKAEKTIADVLRTVTTDEADSLLEALACWVENEQTRTDDGTVSKLLPPAEAILERLNAARAGLAEAGQ
jgi:hypothetical protein